MTDDADDQLLELEAGADRFRLLFLWGHVA